MNKTIFIVGTTASGKTATALRVAEAIDGEIICADSQTLRKDLDIGTAKPSKEEQHRIKHHMIDIIGPYDKFSVAEFKNQAKSIIKDIKKRGRVPIIVGGTGLYIDAVFFDFNLDINSISRQEYEQYSVAELQKIIKTKGFEMPINKNNPRHLIGVIARQGNNTQNKTPISGYSIYGIRRSDDEIKQRINERVEKMISSGLVDEVRMITKKYGQPPDELDAICYPIISKYLSDDISLEKAIEVFKRADWQYARRQKAWFKRNEFIQWFPDESSASEAIIKDVAYS